ncbi:MAG: hypothetical protein RBG1_1C00001G1611 [candidate division Zixibacteria bacterium RBG-1]|nr:MAG: hypothetical protein RBG1_1C00001G1611 [candidate division Zixibacteria bacterium RBG-1]OGC83380.1 MAG: preprotein translocase subunit SecE [candidate division Zixibacteria bacterium RBG_19FT_COMBO_42_43]
MWQKFIRFLKEVRLELTKVTWPTKDELIGSTVVVIILSLILSAFVGLVDLGLSNISRLILK